MKSLEPKDTAERYAIEFQYSATISAITSATVTVQLLAGKGVPERYEPHRELLRDWFETEVNANAEARRKQTCGGI